MEIRNCKRCGKIYQYNGGYICNNCIRQEEEDFQKVKQDVLDHPGATPIEVSERTGVELKVINRFLREGRLEAEDFEIEEGMLECENCRRPIKSGRFCDRCANKLQQEFKKAAASLEPEKKVSSRKETGKETVYTYNAIFNKKKS